MKDFDGWWIWDGFFTASRADATSTALPTDSETAAAAFLAATNPGNGTNQWYEFNAPYIIFVC